MLKLARVLPLEFTQICTTNLHDFTALRPSKARILSQDLFQGTVPAHDWAQNKFGCFKFFLAVFHATHAHTHTHNRDWYPFKNLKGFFPPKFYLPAEDAKTHDRRSVVAYVQLNLYISLARKESSVRNNKSTHTHTHTNGTGVEAQPTPAKEQKRSPGAEERKNGGYKTKIPLLAISYNQLTQTQELATSLKRERKKSGGGVCEWARARTKTKIPLLLTPRSFLLHGAKKSQQPGARGKFSFKEKTRAHILAKTFA